MKLTGKQRYRQALLKASLLRRRSIRQADRDQKAGRPWVILGQTDRKCLEAELERTYEAGRQDGAYSERARCVEKLRQRSLEHYSRKLQYDDEASRISCLESALEALTCAEAIRRLT